MCLKFLLLGWAFVFISLDPRGRVLALDPSHNTHKWGGFSFKIPLRRRRYSHKTLHEDVKWLKMELERVSNKFGPPTTPSHTRRAQSSEELTNQQADFAYYGSVKVGTPCML